MRHDTILQKIVSVNLEPVCNRHDFSRTAPQPTATTPPTTADSDLTGCWVDSATRNGKTYYRLRKRRSDGKQVYVRSLKPHEVDHIRSLCRAANNPPRSQQSGLPSAIVRLKVPKRTAQAIARHGIQMAIVEAGDTTYCSTDIRLEVI